MLSTTNKTCTRCGIQPRRGPGTSTWCRACFNAYRRERRAAAPKKIGRPPRVAVDGKLACSLCKRYLPVDRFYAASDKASGRQARCKDCCPLVQRKTYARHAESRRASARNYRKTKEATDIQFRLARRLRTRLADALRDQLSGSCVGRRGASAVRDLGCTITELMMHLESRFTSGMSWENYGAWQIDHIRPLVSFDLTDPERCRAACRFTNLQPLWATDNRKKGSK